MRRLAFALCRHSSVATLTSTFSLTDDVPNSIPMVAVAVLLIAGSLEYCLSRLWSREARLLSLKLSRRTVVSGLCVEFREPALAGRGPGCPAK